MLLLRFPALAISARLAILEVNHFLFQDFLLPSAPDTLKTVWCL